MKNKFYFDYILMQLLYFFMMGTMLSYGSYALMQLGYSATKTGLLLALGSLLSAILQPIVASISDNSKRISLFNICVVVSLVCIVLSTLTYIQSNASLLLSVLFVGLLGIFNILEPLINTVPSILKYNGIEINFGIGRAVGSLGYALANALLGILTGIYPYHVVFLTALVVSVALLIVNIKANKDFLFIQTKVNKDNDLQTISYAQFLKRHKTFLLLMICTTGIYLGYTMTDNMMILVVQNVGGNNSDLGLIMAFKACLEIPVIFFYDKFEKLSSPEQLLKVAAVSFILKAAALCFSKTITMIYINQLLQLTSLSIEVAAMVSYINKIMDKKEIARGQAMFVMATTVASVLSSLLSGSISDYFSTNTMLLVSFIITGISAISFVFVINKKK